MTGRPIALSEDLLAGAETNHRVANNLALLASMLEVDARHISDTKAALALTMTRQRIHAIANLHRQLCHSPQHGVIDVAPFLIELGSSFAAIVENRSRARRLLVQAESMLFSSEQATAFGMLVAELVGNACKHAYASDVPGDVRISFVIVPEGGWELCVEDNGAGIGAPLAPLAGHGIGTRIVEAAARRLGGRHRWEDAMPGTRFLLRRDPPSAERPFPPGARRQGRIYPESGDNG